MVKNNHKNRIDASDINNNTEDSTAVELITSEGLSVKLYLYDTDFKEKPKKRKQIKRSHLS